MSTDPKKLVKTILLSYFLAAIILASGYTCNGVPILFVSFSLIALAIFISGCLALHQNYKKYKIGIYLFLEIIGIVLSLFVILMMIIQFL